MKNKFIFLSIFIFFTLFNNNATENASINNWVHIKERSDTLRVIEEKELSGKQIISAGSWTTSSLLYDTIKNRLTFKSGNNFIKWHPSLLVNTFYYSNNKIDYSGIIENSFYYLYKDILIAQVDGIFYKRIDHPQFADTAPFLSTSGVKQNQKLTDYEHITGASGFDAEQSTAYLEVRTPVLDIGFGRRKLRWGPGFNGSLILPGNVPLNCYYLINKRIEKYLSFSAFFGSTDYHRSFFPDNKPDTTNFAQGERYAGGHRLEGVLFDRIRIGLNEIVNLNGQREFNRYINPLQMYYLVSSNSDLSSNLLASIDIWAKVSNGIAIYGEFLNDDITIFEKGNPSRFAYQLGATYIDTTKKYSIRGEYTYVKAYCYTHFETSRNWYLWSNRTAGYWTGPDADHMFLFAEKTFYKERTFRLTFNYLRRGQLDILTGWNRKNGSGENTPYLQGTVEKSMGVDLSGNIYILKMIDIYSVIGYQYTKNPYHVKSKNISFPYSQIIFRVTY